MNGNEKGPARLREADPQPFSGFKGTDNPGEQQILPCIGCARYHYCGAFLWTDCTRFKGYLKNLKNLKGNEQ